MYSDRMDDMLRANISGKWTSVSFPLYSAEPCAMLIHSCTSETMLPCRLDTRFVFFPRLAEPAVGDSARLFAANAWL